MSSLSRGAIIILIALGGHILGGCRTASVHVEVPAGPETDPAAEALQRARDEVAERDQRITHLEAARNTARDDLDRALTELAQLREERLALLHEVDRLRLVERGLREAATANAQGAHPALPTDQTVDDAHPGADATGTFVTITRAGYHADPRAAGRLAAWSPGIAVDTAGPVPILFDTRHRYNTTMAHLTIEDPQGRSPQLVLTVQHVSERSPLLLHTAVLTVEGGDPVDPIEPIVLSGEGRRETDGRLFIESLRLAADAPVARRLAAMISSPRLVLTFVGTLGERIYRPPVSERAAMANIIFAFMDLDDSP